MVQRRSYKVIGTDGAVSFEIQRNDQGALEVAELDDMGNQDGGVIILHNWDAAREKVGSLVDHVISSGRVG